MKLWILIAILLVTVSVVQAADNQWSTPIKTIDSCDNLSILLLNHTLNYDPDEIDFSACSGDKLWICACNGSNFALIMDAKITTVNDYTFQLNYTSHSISTSETTRHRRGGGGGGIRIGIWNVSENGTILNQTIATDVYLDPYGKNELHITDPYLKPEETQPSAEEAPVNETEQSKPLLAPIRDWTRVFWAVGISVAIIIAIFIYIIIASTKEKEEE